MESRHSSPDLSNQVPNEEQTFPRLTQSSLSQLEGQSVDALSGEFSFSRTTTEIADDDALSQIQDQSVGALAGGIPFSRTATEIADDDALSLFSTDESTETSEAQQDVDEIGQVGDVGEEPTDNQPFVKTGKRAKKLLQSVTEWNEDIRGLVESEIDYQDLKKSLSTISNDMTSVIADCTDECAKLVAAITKLRAEKSALTFRFRQVMSVDQPEDTATEPVELPDEQKQQRPSAQFLEDAQCRALAFCREGSPEPDDSPVSNATRSAGWSSQKLPKTRLPPPLTIQNLPLPRQRSVGGDWTDATFEASGSNLSQLPPSAELSPDTPTHARRDAKATNIQPKLGSKKRDSVASISPHLSTDRPGPPLTKRRSQKAPSTGTKSHRASQILGGSTRPESRARYSPDVLRDSLPRDDLALPMTVMHNSEAYQGFNQEESDEEGMEEALDQGRMSRFSSRPPSLNVQRLSRFSTWMLDLPIQKLLSMAKLSRGGQSLDQELDAIRVEEASNWDPASQRSSRYINLRSRRPADRSSYVLCDTTQDVHTPAIDDDEAVRNMFGPSNKSAGGLLMRVLAVAYLGLLVVTIQVYIASLRQQEIWLNANGLTREYMLRTCLETPAWMLVPGVDGELVLGVDEAGTAFSWLWRLFPWNSSIGSGDGWTYAIDGA